MVEEGAAAARVALDFFAADFSVEEGFLAAFFFAAAFLVREAFDADADFFCELDLV